MASSIYDINPTTQLQNNPGFGGTWGSSQYMLNPSNGLTLKSGSQDVLNQFVNSQKTVGTWGNNLTPQTDTTTSGGTGGTGGTTSTAPSAPNPYFDPGTGNTFPSYDAYVNEVNRVYGEAEGLLNNLEGQTRANEQNYYKTASAPFEAQLPILEQAKGEGLQRNEKQITDTKRGREDAFARASRLYQELTQGAQQRFGGSTSAGGFANALLGRELQRNLGSITDTSDKNVRDLIDKGDQIINNYTTQLQSIEKEKQGALAQARLQFQQRIDEINNSRLAVAQNKAQLKLNEFGNLRNTILQIQQNAQAYQQQIQSAIGQAQAQIAANVQQYRAQAGQPVNLQAFQDMAYSGFGGGTSGAPRLTNNITGSIREDELNRLGFNR